LPSFVSRIDDVIHGRVRLGIVTYLATVDAAEFNELKALLETTAGNLSVHLRKLEDAGYVAIAKSFISRKSMTRVRITKSGRTALVAYLAELRALLDSQEAGKPASDAKKPVASAAHKRKRA
jgi:DNA-binding MarR family transcriptional regulator